MIAATRSADCRHEIINDDSVRSAAKILESFDYSFNAVWKTLGTDRNSEGHYAKGKYGDGEFNDDFLAIFVKITWPFP